MKPARPPRPAVVLSCEHASNAVPARYAQLGLGRAALASHIAYDIGALDVARFYARALGCELFEGRWSRLVVDLNRSVGHRALVAERSFGIDVPGNRDVSADEKRRRIREYHEPYRSSVAEALTRALERGGSCVHLSVHSFTPAVNGSKRNADVGLLYDPSRRNERSFARLWAQALATAGLRVRLNYPYRGTADGFTRDLRRMFRASRYTGLEIELNQALLGDRRRRTHIAHVTELAFVATLAVGEEG